MCMITNREFSLDLVNFTFSFLDDANFLVARLACMKFREATRNHLKERQELRLKGSVDLSGSTLKDEDLLAQIKNIPVLKELILKNCSQISDKALEKIVLSSPSSLKINLEGCPEVSWYGLVLLAKKGVPFANIKANEKTITFAKERYYATTAFYDG